MDRNQKVIDLIAGAQEEGRNLLEHEVLQLLDAYRLPLPPFKFIPYGSPIDAEQMEGITYPLVLKVVSTEIIHKSDVGGVRLHINSFDEVLEAIDTMESGIHEKLPKARIDGWLLRSFIPSGTELIAGSIIDDRLGTAIMAGIGGVFTEAYKDVSFRLVPISKTDALEMLDELKGQPILDGLRTGDPLNRDKIANFLALFSRFIHENPEIAECDLNPLICRGDSIMIADARVKLKEN